MDLAEHSCLILIEETTNQTESQQNKVNQNMLVFGERRKPEYPGKTSFCRVENQQTQPTYDSRSGNWTQATLMEGECSRHCTNPAEDEKIEFLKKVWFHLLVGK